MYSPTKFEFIEFIQTFFKNLPLMTLHDCSLASGFYLQGQDIYCRDLECVRACVRSHVCVRNLGCERVRSLSEIVRAKCVRAGFFGPVAPAQVRTHF